MNYFETVNNLILNRYSAGWLAGVLIGTFGAIIIDPMSGISIWLVIGVLVGCIIAQARSSNTGTICGAIIGIPVGILLLQFNMEEPSLGRSLLLGLFGGTMFGGVTGWLYGMVTGGVDFVSNTINDLKQLKSQVDDIELKVNEIHSMLK